MTTTTDQRTRPEWHHLLRTPQLEKLGVRVLNRFDGELECISCHERWSPHRLPDGRLPKGYWQCPNRCNW